MKPFEIAYEYQFIGIDSNGVYRYSFESLGKKKVTKIISITYFQNIKIYGGHWYNISFVNKDEKDANNTNDFDKILATVFVCAINFLTKKTKAKIMFFGDTIYKQKLYKRKIYTHIDILSTMLNVRGVYINKKIPIIKKTQKRVRDNGKEVETVIETKDIDSVVDTINIHQIESYKRENSKDYDFILIQLNKKNGENNK